MSFKTDYNTQSSVYFYSIHPIPTIHMGASASALEKKGIETDKGNINREIKKHNSLVKVIKNKIKEWTNVK
ncbi:hypothetical protein [Streptococcus agalactiae]